MRTLHLLLGIMLVNTFSACQKQVEIPENQSKEMTILKSVAGEVKGVAPEQIQTDRPLAILTPPFSGDDLVELLYVSEERLGIMFPITEIERFTGATNNDDIAGKLTLGDLEAYAVEQRQKKKEKLDAPVELMK